VRSDKAENGGGEGGCRTLAGDAEHPVVSRTKKTEREERGRGRRGKGAGEEGGRKEGLREGGKGRGEGKLITSIQDMFNCCISCILWWAVS